MILVFPLWRVTKVTRTGCCGQFMLAQPIPVFKHLAALQIFKNLRLRTSSKHSKRRQMPSSIPWWKMTATWINIKSATSWTRLRVDFLGPSQVPRKKRKKNQVDLIHHQGLKSESQKESDFGWWFQACVKFKAGDVFLCFATCDDHSKFQFPFHGSCNSLIGPESAVYRSKN